jgi:voltage-gated potassium channel
VALGFYRATPALKPLVFSQFIIGLFCTVAIFEVESEAQPDKFVTLFDAAYFTMVTVATVGYGDISPANSRGQSPRFYFRLLAIGF